MINILEKQVFFGMLVDGVLLTAEPGMVRLEVEKTYTMRLLA